MQPELTIICIFSQNTVMMVTLKNISNLKNNYQNMKVFYSSDIFVKVSKIFLKKKLSIGILNQLIYYYMKVSLKFLISVFQEIQKIIQPLVDTPDQDPLYIWLPKFQKEKISTPNVMYGLWVQYFSKCFTAKPLGSPEIKKN